MIWGRKVVELATCPRAANRDLLSDTDSNSIQIHGNSPVDELVTTALSRSSVLLVNRAGRSQATCLYFNALGQLSPSQIGSKIAYSWPM